MAELLHALETEWKGLRSDAEWKAFRDRWMARKNGILTQINELWLKPAPAGAKPKVGRWINELRHRVDEAVETSRRKVKANS